METDVGPGPATGARTSIYIDEFAHRNPIPAASRIGNIVYASSVHGKDPVTGEVAETLEAQCHWMFAHMRTVIEAARGHLDDIIKVTIWMADRSQRGQVNREWLALFPDPASRPARHTMRGDLDDGQLIVCDFVAVIGAHDGTEGEDL